MTEREKIIQDLQDQGMIVTKLMVKVNTGNGSYILMDLDEYITQRFGEIK